MATTSGHRSFTSYAKNHIYLQNGVKIQVNDHVYLAAESNYESFYIGRVMEFLQPTQDESDSSPTIPTSHIRRASSRRTSTAGSSTSLNASKAEVDSRSPSNLFVAIAWYQRPSEVSDGRSRSQDPRLVVATMHSDVNPVSTIRGKCVVTHAYHILEVLQCYQHSWQKRATFDTRPASLLSPTQAPPPLKRRQSGRPSRSEMLAANGHSIAGPPAPLRSDLGTLSREEALAVYTSLPDHFYFTQLFDRFVGRNYDVVPCEKVLNVPDNIAQALRDRYRYIIVEPTKTSELTDSHRSCKVCTQWCPPNESMRCEMCGYYYHMGCLDPPLATKPGKGYVWQCVSCLKQMAQQRMGNQGDNPRLRTRSQPAPKPVGTDMGRSSSQQIRSTSSTVRPTSATSATVPPSPVGGMLPPKPSADSIPGFGLSVEKLPPPPPPAASSGWPFRYLGIYSNINDVIDYDDRIYPRAASRLGVKYQANVPTHMVGHGPAVSIDLPADSQPPSIEPDQPAISDRTQSSSVDDPPTESTAVNGRRSRRWSRKNPPTDDLSEAARSGSDPPIERHRDELDLDSHIFFDQPADLADADLDQYIENCRRVSPSELRASLEVMDRALSALRTNNYNPQKALKFFTAHYRALPDFGVAQWSAKEQADFESQLAKTGADMPALHEAVGLTNKTRPQMVRHFYTWKGSKAGRQAYDRYVADNFKPSWKGAAWSQGEKSVTGLSVDSAKGKGSLAAHGKANPTEQGSSADQSQASSDLLNSRSKWSGICDPEATVSNLRDEGWIIDTREPPVADSDPGSPNSSNMDIDQEDDVYLNTGTGSRGRSKRSDMLTCLNCQSVHAERWKVVPLAAMPSMRVYHSPTASSNSQGFLTTSVVTPLTTIVSRTLQDGLLAHEPISTTTAVYGSRSNPGTEVTPVTQAGLQPHPSPLPSATTPHIPMSGTVSMITYNRRQRNAVKHLCDVCGYYWLKYSALPGVGEYERFLINTMLFSPLAGPQLIPLLTKFDLSWDTIRDQLLDPLAVAPLMLFTSLYLIPSSLNGMQVAGGAPGDLSVFTGRAISRGNSRGPSRASTPNTPSGWTFALEAPPHARRREGSADSHYVPPGRGSKQRGAGSITTPQSGRKSARGLMVDIGDDDTPVRGKRSMGPRSAKSGPRSPDTDSPKNATKRLRVVQHSPTPCAVCIHPDTKHPALLTCSDCGLSVHAFCYGVPDSAGNPVPALPLPVSDPSVYASLPRPWSCDACRNVRQPYISRQYSCILCRQPGRSPLYGPVSVYEALKPTVDNNWVHMWCALGIPEMTFGNGASLQPVEGTSALLYNRWTHQCEICLAAVPPPTPFDSALLSEAITPILSRTNSRMPLADTAATPTKIGLEPTNGTPLAQTPSQDQRNSSRSLRPKRSPVVRMPSTPNEANQPLGKIISSADECSLCVPCRAPSCRRYIHVSCAIRSCLQTSPGQPLASPGGLAGYRVGFEAITQDRATRPTPLHASASTVATPTTATPKGKTIGKRGAADRRVGSDSVKTPSWPDRWAPTGANTVEITDIAAFFTNQGRLSPVVYCPVHNKERQKNFVALSATDKSGQPILAAYIQHSRLSHVPGRGALLKSRLMVQELAKFPPYNRLTTEMGLLGSEVPSTLTCWSDPEGPSTFHRLDPQSSEPTLVPPSLALAILARDTDQQLGNPAARRMPRTLQQEYVWPISSIPSPPSPQLPTLSTHSCVECGTAWCPLWWSRSDVKLFNDMMQRYRAKLGGASEQGGPDSSDNLTAEIERLLRNLPLQQKGDYGQDVFQSLLDAFTKVRQQLQEQALDANSPALGPGHPVNSTRESLYGSSDAPAMAISASSTSPNNDCLCHRCFIQSIRL
ncbi:putative PHD type zinc finger protein with BAH domain-containing protein [Dimargaris cristalligena]|nr:putative PHD type zinc finger protein with BAH domain-containing protein [Dimargaris cristalligena]